MIKRWNDVKRTKPNRPIEFVHIPKTGGTFVKSVLKQTSINNTSRYGGTIKNHTPKKNTHNINFSVIRHPVDRFESFLNFRLNEKHARSDWPNKVRNVYNKNNKNTTLNDIVARMTKTDILSFSPFSTIKYYTQDIDIFITINNVEKFLRFFGYKVNVDSFKKQNVSPKTRGTLNAKTRRRIAQIYSEDMKIYNKLRKKNLI